jgi:hypothetical protein
MNKPPVITALYEEGESGSVVDTAVSKTFTDILIEQSTAFRISATDPEGDPITCAAYLRQPWMSFNPSLCRLNMTPPASALGKTFYVKFVVTTPSGGTDAIIGIFKILEFAGSAQRFAGALSPAEEALSDGANPSAGAFSLGTPHRPGVAARLEIFDLGGRRLREIRAPSGARIEWNGHDASGRIVQPGIYLYRLFVGRDRRDGKFIVVR